MTEYAVRTIVLLANTSEPQSTEPIAKATHVPPGNPTKGPQCLGRSGLVTETASKHDSFVLTHPSADITVRQVVNAVDPLRRITTCPLGLKSRGKVLCPLHKRLDDAIQMVENSFADTTILELLTTPSASKPLCEIAG